MKKYKISWNDVRNNPPLKKSKVIEARDRSSALNKGKRMPGADAKSVTVKEVK